MRDFQTIGTDPAEMIAGLSAPEIDEFVRRSIAEKALTPIVRSLNKSLLNGDTPRRQAAETALRRIGFL